MLRNWEVPRPPLSGGAGLPSFAALIKQTGIDLPSHFADPRWDPVPTLLDWNEKYGPRIEEGVPHWDGNAVLRSNEVVDLTLLPSESGRGAERVLVRVFDNGVVALSFLYRGKEYPMHLVENGDELRGMLRILRVVQGKQ